MARKTGTRDCVRTCLVSLFSFCYVVDQKESLISDTTPSGSIMGHEWEKGVNMPF